MVVMEKNETRDWLILENEGQKIFSVLHLPPVETPPIVIIFHGFASHKVGTARSYVHLAEALCKANIACLRFDFRGSGDSEGELSEMTLEGLISDALTVTDYVEHKNFASIGYYGSSLGGALSILTAARHPIIRALVTWAPVASGELWLKDYLAHRPKEDSVFSVEELATYRGVHLNSSFREQFGKMSAYKTLEALEDIPFLHFQGEKDQVLSSVHQKMFQMQREGAHAPSRFVTCPDTGHWLGYSKMLPQVIEETVNWFKHYL